MIAIAQSQPGANEQEAVLLREKIDKYLYIDLSGGVNAEREGEDVRLPVHLQPGREVLHAVVREVRTQCN